MNKSLIKTRSAKIYSRSQKRKIRAMISERNRIPQPWKQTAGVYNKDQLASFWQTSLYITQGTDYSFKIY